MKQLILAFICLVTTAGTSASPRATWRLDFFHTGGQGIEVFSVDKVVVEPLPWPGPKSADLDRTGYGTYRFEVRDTTGTILYSRGYGPIFAEWLTTDEAATMHRTFEESLRFPEPTSIVDILVFKRDKANRFVEAWRTRIDPKNQFIDRSIPPLQTAIEIEHNGDPTTKVDLLMLGDGYTAAECAAKFKKDARRMADALFAVEPYKSRRKDFNVWGICPPSAKSGISRPSTGFYNATPVGATYDVFGAERYVLTMNNRAFRNISSWAPYEFVELLVNNETYGGGGLYNVFATAAVDNDWASYLFVHEFAHHFAGLADEYYTSPDVYNAPESIVEPWEPNVTALLDRKNLKWKNLATPGVPIPTPWPKEKFEAYEHGIQARRVKLRADNRPESEMTALFREEGAAETALFASSKYAKATGAFQGANYDAAAYYRPSIDCIMFGRNNVPFCPVCRHTIDQVIDFNSGR